MSDNLKIAMVTDWFPPRKGGVETVVHELSSELASRDGVEVEVLTGGFPKRVSFSDKVEYMGDLKVRRLSGMVLPDFLEEVYLHPELPFKLKKLFKDEDYDVVHVHPLFTPFSAFSLTIAKQMNPARDCVVRTNHTYKGRDLSFLRKFSYKCLVGPAEVDRIFASSKAARSFEIEQGADPDKVKLVPLGANVEKLHPNKYSEDLRDDLGIGDSVFLLFVGRLIERKGLDYLLEAFQLARESAEMELVILGEGPQRKKLEKFAKGLEVEDSVHFVGQKSDSELQRFYATCDFVVAPSVGEEAFGLVIPEAMASGKPIIAGDIDAYSEVFVDNTGFLVSPENVHELKDKILKLAKDEDLRRKMGRRARKEAVKNYSWENTADLTLEVYNEVLSEV